MSCSTDEEPFWLQETSYVPIIMKRTDMEAAVRVGPAEAILQPGKIFTRGGYLFISERYKGVHLIDNRNPKEPTPVSFIRVPGCLDIAVRGSFLYLDSGTDLLTFDISQIASPQLVSRAKNVFPGLIPPDGGVLPAEFQEENRPEGTIITGWELVE